MPAHSTVDVGRPGRDSGAPGAAKASARQPRMEAFFAPAGPKGGAEGSDGASAPFPTVIDAAETPRKAGNPGSPRLPPEILRMIVHLALPPCSFRKEPYCDPSCERAGCSCPCRFRRKLAAKLCRVSWLFCEVASRRIWGCADLELSGRRTSFGTGAGRTESDRLLLFADGMDALARRTPHHAGRMLNRVEVILDPGTDDSALDRLSNVLSGQNGLRTLSVRAESHFDAGGLLWKSVRCSDGTIEHLQAHNADCSPTVWSAILLKLPRLRTFAISGSLEGPTPFPAIADCSPRTLDSLLLGPWDVSEELREEGIPILGFGDEDFRSFVARVDAIKRLRLQFCFQIGNAAFSLAFAKADGMTLLDLGFTSVSDESLARLQSTSLTVLGLTLTAVADGAVVRLVERNPGLLVVKLRGTNIGDATIAALVKHTKSLRYLDVSFTSVTETGIRILLHSTTMALGSLYLASLPLDDASMHLLAAAFPGLHALDIGSCRGIVEPETLFAVTYELRRTLGSLNIAEVPAAEGQPGLDDALRRVIDFY